MFYKMYFDICVKKRIKSITMHIIKQMGKGIFRSNKLEHSGGHVQIP